MPLDPTTLTDPNTPNDTAPISSTDRAILKEIDETKLSTYIIERLKAIIRDREEFGWSGRRVYDVLSYEGIKGKATEPWYNASNFPVPLTATLLDTAHAHTIGSIWSDPNKVVAVKGVGQEDERTSHSLESLLNWQTVNDIENAYEVLDTTVHKAYKHGNAYIKVIHGSGGQQQRPKVLWSIVPAENMFLPVNAKGAQPSETPLIGELIPLDENDWEVRKLLKKPDGSPFYKDIKDVAKGSSIYNASEMQSITQVKDIASGTSLGSKYSRDMRYIMEIYLTYPHRKNDQDDPVMVELIVWLATGGGKVLNFDLNPDYDEDVGDFVRPYSVKWIPYPHDDRHYGESLCWRLKHIQEELDYAHNQNMNAAEIAIKPPKFYRAGSGFDPEAYETTPDGWYPTANPTQDIYIPTFNVNPIFERQEDHYWDLAERLTGLTELFQGRSPNQRQTATLTVARETKSEIRFNTIYRRLQLGFNELMQLTYFYDRLYMPDEVKVKVLGYADYRSVGELFPKGIRGRYNFFFASSTTVEQQQQKQDAETFYNTAILNPIVATNPANLWRSLNFYAKSKGILDLDSIVTKPPEAEIFSPDEAIRRILSGEYNVVPDPQIDASAYMTKILTFMRTDTFLKGDPEIQQAVTILLQRVKAIQMGQMQAIQDAQLMNQVHQSQAQAMSQNLQQPGQQPTNGAAPIQ